LSYTIPYNLLIDINSPDLKEHCNIAGKMFGYKQRTSFRALRSVLSNLFIAKDRQVMAGRERDSLGDEVTNPLRIGYAARNTAIDKLHKAGFVDVDKGSHSEGRMTTIVATDKLQSWFKTTGWSKDKLTKKFNGYISVRSSKKEDNKAQLVDFKPTEYSRWLENKLEEYNKFLNEQEINIEINSNRMSYEMFHLSRPFIRHKIGLLETLKNRDFIFGGRMYGPWANASGNDRKTILINGQPTIELDRVASHLNAMYQFVTDKPYPSKDAYYLEIDGVEIPRQIVKKYSSLMQGSKPGYQSTAMRVARSFRQDAEKKTAKQEDKDNFELFKQWKKKYTPTQIIDNFLNKHPKISKHYRKGKAYGDLISCWESDILFEILIDLTAKGIPALSVYDSVIVPKQYEDYVKWIINTMEYQDRKYLRELLLK
jgi:hypothetical protein